ncbi:MAG: LuxR C-terminal-related transcriptional regulator, partial [Chloroflexota bacterium]
QAHLFLSAALAIAEPVKYLQPFINEGEQMARLLRSMQTGPLDEHLDGFIGEVQANFMPSGAQPAQVILDPLTKREIEVLHLIASGLSNPEIGKRLIVATGTVAKHTNSIFSKLAVRNRTEAVSRAQKLGIL